MDQSDADDLAFDPNRLVRKAGEAVYIKLHDGDEAEWATRKKYVVDFLRRVIQQEIGPAQRVVQTIADAAWLEFRRAVTDPNETNWMCLLDSDNQNVAIRGLHRVLRFLDYTAPRYRCNLAALLEQDRGAVNRLQAVTEARLTVRVRLLLPDPTVPQAHDLAEEIGREVFSAFVQNELRQCFRPEDVIPSLFSHLEKEVPQSLRMREDRRRRAEARREAARRAAATRKARKARR